MPFTGVSHKVGEHIDTDAIIPARFLVTTDPKKLGENCMEGLEHGWVKRVQVGDILVAERNFGCGSSREHAPIAILGAGMKAVIAHSFARIFYRNAFNMGLLLLEIGDDVNKIKDGDKLEVSPEEGVIKNLTTGETIKVPALSPVMQNLIDKGGLVNYVREEIEAGKSDEEVRQHLIDRYGEFVLLKPAFSWGNAALWAAPLLVVIAGLLLLMRSFRNRIEEESLSPEEAERLKRLSED